MEMKNEEKEWVFPPIGQEDADSCRALWIAIITQQVIDARSKDKKPEAQKRKKEALEWLLDDSAGNEFAEACHLAGIDPGLFRERVSFFLTHEEALIDFRCKRKHDSLDFPPRDRLKGAGGEANRNRGWTLVAFFPRSQLRSQ